MRPRRVFRVAGEDEVNVQWRRPVFAGAELQAPAHQSVRLSARCHRARLTHPARLVLEMTPREWRRLRQNSVAKAAA
jgi:hypothetical protein